MKVVCSANIIEKCDANNLNDYGITYMSKLNEVLKTNAELTINSCETGLAEICGGRTPRNFALDERTNGTSNGGSVEPAENVVDREDDEDGESSPKSGDELWNSDAESSSMGKSAISDNLSCPDSGLGLAASTWDKSVTEVKEHAFTKLEEELQQAREILKLRDEEVITLRKIRQDVENELLELTASLFQEAHRMVRDANAKQAAAEKALLESRMQVDVLTGEVEALKTLVLTSTPSKPNLHLHGQSKEDSSAGSNGSNFFKKHNRSPSHFDLKYGRSESPSCTASLENINHSSQNESLDIRDDVEVDPNVFREFVLWKENPSLEKDNPFITHMYREDIDQCLDFNNTNLTNEVKKAIDADNIFVEAVDKAKSHFPKRCALMEIPRSCFYRMKIADTDDWHYISQMCRNRIIAVCNFLNYLRYIQRGLVKSPVEDMYWEIVKLRKEMMLAKLGLPISSHSP